MRYLFIFMLCLILMAMAIPVSHAQRDTSAPPVNGIYKTYYENPSTNQLTADLDRLNVCFERFALLNPDLDYLNIPYGTPIWLPVDEPCYDYAGRDMTSNVLPRLKYYEDGQWLDEPYYSDTVIYTRHNTIENIAYSYNVCVEDLLRENYALIHYTIEEQAYFTVDIFIPEDTHTCLGSEETIDPPMRNAHTTLELSADMANPLHLLNEFNVCAEDRSSHGWDVSERYDPQNTSLKRIFIWENAQPCYNDHGQRLRYFDDEGRQLAKPIYSDLKVYVVPIGQTLPDIAAQHGVCLHDLLRVNGFPQLPSRFWLEIFIPPSRSCDEEIDARQVVIGRIGYYTVENLAHRLNICPEALAYHNPHLPTISQAMRRWHWGEQTIPYYHHGGSNTLIWAIYPVESEPCYTVVNVPLQTGLYEISREYNVCVHDLLNANNDPIDWYNTSPDKTIFIPNTTRPCYDTETGKMLLYFDDDQNPLTTPQPMDHLIHYGDWKVYAAYIYNVCVNQIEEANRAKLDGEASYVGWIIPTDRPPCYYNEGNRAHFYYECYAQNGADFPCFDDYTPETHAIHRLAAGESLGSLSTRYDVPLWLIARANDIDPNRVLSRNRTLVIPLNITKTRIYQGIVLLQIGIIAGIAGIFIWQRQAKPRRKD